MQQRVGTSIEYLADRMGAAPVPVIPCPQDLQRRTTAGNRVSSRNDRPRDGARVLATINRGEIPTEQSQAALHYGRLYAAIRDRNNIRVRSPEPARWADTEAGRILFALDGVGWITLSGAGSDTIASAG